MGEETRKIAALEAALNAMTFQRDTWRRRAKYLAQHITDTNGRHAVGLALEVKRALAMEPSDG